MSMSGRDTQSTETTPATASRYSGSGRYIIEAEFLVPTLYLCIARKGCQNLAVMKSRFKMETCKVLVASFPGSPLVPTISSGRGESLGTRLKCLCVGSA